MPIWETKDDTGNEDALKVLNMAAFSSTSSSSSSSSTSKATKKRRELRKAKEVLYSKDPSYRAWIDKEAEAIEEKKLQVSGNLCRLSSEP